MLEAVSAPLRAYLKGRADTVRQIVTSLTDPEASELLEVDGGEDGQSCSRKTSLMKSASTPARPEGTRRRC